MARHLDWRPTGRQVGLFSLLLLAGCPPACLPSAEPPATSTATSISRLHDNAVDDSDDASSHDGHDPSASRTTTAPPGTTSGPTSSTTSPPSGGSAPITPIAGCREGEMTPVGQANPPIELEPLGGVWCFNRVAAPAATRVEGQNSWEDSFDTGVPMHAFDDGDMEYVIFDKVGELAFRAEKSEMFVNNNHWMSDVYTHDAGSRGSAIRPDRSFEFEDGTFVIEADVAASMEDYDANGVAWPELTVTNAPRARRARPQRQRLRIWAVPRLLGGQLPSGRRLSGLRGDGTVRRRGPR